VAKVRVEGKGPLQLIHIFLSLDSSSSFRDDDDEGGDEKGEDVNETSVAGGGHAIGGNADVEARKKLRVSHALRAFLAHTGAIQDSEVGGDDSETQVSRASNVGLDTSQVVTHRPFSLPFSPLPLYKRSWQNLKLYTQLMLQSAITPCRSI
jgi:hypothetical protein